MKIKYILFILFLSNSSIHPLLAQENSLTLGLQFRPIIPTGISNSGSFEFDDQAIDTNGDVVNVNILVEPELGYSWGAIVRKGITNTISLETGISYVRRNFNFTLTDLDTNFTGKTTFGFVNYEIPINGLIYIRLGEQTYMNNSLGISLDMYASDVQSFGGDDFAQLTYKRKWLQPAINANLGFEYRTKESGYFYVGLTFHSPFSTIAISQLNYRKNLEILNFFTELEGGYLTLDFRYFFNPEQ